MATLTANPSGARHAPAHALGVFLATRLPLFALSYLGLALFPVDGTEGKWRAFPDNYFLDGWPRWDSGWYYNIASHGYGPAEIPFFPLYPLLIRAGSPLFGGNAYLAGIFVANAAFLGALVLLGRLARRYVDEASARRAQWLLAVFPFAFFFSAMYTESLFLCLALLAFEFAAQRKTWQCGVTAALVGAVRPNGFLISVGLALLAWEQSRAESAAAGAPELRHARGTSWRRIAVPPLLGFAGPLAYAVYLHYLTGTATSWLGAQAAWSIHGGLDPLLSMLHGISESILKPRYSVVELLQWLAWLLGLVLCLIGLRDWRRRAAGHLPLGYWVWASLNVLLAFSRWHSAGRFTAVLFPCFIWLGTRLRGQAAFNAALVGSAVLLALLTLVFTHWYWIL